ncbi:AraC family transcriptional regulator ligand-binding domain-containing protein [Cupriavidus basilensis]
MQHVGKLIRSASLNGYIELVEPAGRDPHAFLRGVGPSAAARKSRDADPSHAVRELLEVTARATGVEDLALRLAARRTFSNLGPISLVLKEEPTPRQALDTLCRYLKLLSATLITRIEDAGQSVIIREDLLPSPGLATRQAMELAVGVKFRILRGTGSVPSGGRWRFASRTARRSTRRRTAPSGAARCSISRSTAWSARRPICRRRARPTIRAPAGFARDYLEAAPRHRDEGVRESCRELILGLAPGGTLHYPAGGASSARRRRTLHRYLSAEGLTFSVLLKQVRSELVMRHLQESDPPIGEVAGLLGFSALSSFSHWFHAAFGCSVSDWRKRVATGS